ncbi:MAG: bpX6 domain-containing protein, partial [Betaproteobacteria bacterium]
MARPVLLGHQAVAALWLPHEWFDEAARRRRIVQAWRPGCTALRFADGDLLRFASELVDDCEALPGWPLRRVAGVLCSAEIDPADLAGRAHADVLLAQGGAWRGLQLVEAQPLDPSTWIDVGLGLVDTFDCRLPAVERRLVEPVARELREVLGDSVPGAPTAETRSFLAALAARGKRNGPQAPGAAPRHPHPGFQTDSRGGAAEIAAVLAAVVLAGGIAALLFGDPESGQGSGGHLPSSVFYALGFLVFYLMRFGAGRGKPGAGAAAPARQAASAAPAGAGS